MLPRILMILVCLMCLPFLAHIRADFDFQEDIDGINKDSVKEENINLLEEQFKADCKCDNGKCVIEKGQEVCTCNPEYGMYKYKSKGSCKGKVKVGVKWSYVLNGTECVACRRERNPSTRVYVITIAVEGSRNSVHPVWQRKTLHPYHLRTDTARHRLSCMFNSFTGVSQLMCPRYLFLIFRFAYK
ncbi:hypothetical protein CEXT_51171 [Caerostris extrusa]|uniref:EGF-like domain-containing protein n=1 Tax=Caerostris extrusa TaxID=172846 RepID=A0AAV4RSP1_CAEEX|nr:hypothetical protein CEXT_51171 [Caerostris extrusa]